jgi:hypothetical protein
MDFGSCLKIMGFACDFEFDPNMLRGGQDDTQDYVVQARKFSTYANIFDQKIACVIC